MIHIVSPVYNDNLMYKNLCKNFTLNIWLNDVTSRLNSLFYGEFLSRTNREYSIKGERLYFTEFFMWKNQACIYELRLLCEMRYYRFFKIYHLE